MIKTLLRFLLVIFILSTAIAAFVLTPSGLRLSVDVAAKLLPGKLSYKKISGVIIGPIKIDDFKYEDKEKTISADEVRVNWNSLDLFKKELHITSLDVQNLQVISHDTTPTHWDAESINQAIGDLHTTVTDQIFPLHLIINNMKLSARIDKPVSLNIQFQWHQDTKGNSLRLLLTGDHTDWELIGGGNQQSWHFHTIKNLLLQGALDADFYFQPTGHWRAKLTANNINLSRLNPALTSSLTGKFTGTENTNDLHIQLGNSHFHITAQHNHAWHIHGNFSSTHGKLSRAGINLMGDFHDGQWQGLLNQFTLQFKKIGAFRLEKPTTASASENTLHFADICLNSKRAGNVCIRNGMLNNQHLSGQIQMNVNNFAWANAWSHLFIPSGDIRANLTVSGTLIKPVLSGTVNLDHGNIIFPQLHITLHTITGSITSSAEQLNFTAQAFSNNQPINLKGNIDLSQPRFLATAVLTSNNTLIIHTDQYAVYATTHLKATVKNKDVYLTGTINVPKGSMTAHDFQVTTKLPDDDIVYTAGVAHPPKPFWLLHINVSVTLHKIKLAAFHTNAHLYGTMQLMQEPNHEMFANGSINVRKGTYTLYGQTLTLAPTSELEFSNSFIDNPIFHLKATKVIRNVNLSNTSTSDISDQHLIVGIELHGPANALKITFFSNRASLSQSDILSYLLLGYGGSETTSGNTDILLRALSAVNVSSQGLTGKQNIATQIQQGLGLREMGVESETTTEANGNPLNRQSAFVVGKNIAHNFYVRYSIGLLDPVDVIELRYLINKHWSVQTDSSTLGNGADVFYTLEKD